MIRIRSVDHLVELVRDTGLPEPVREYRFHPIRRWRFDLAWVDRKIAVEYNGGVWIRGRHTRGIGYTGDLEKLNTAQAMGWRVFQYAPGMPVRPFLRILYEVYYAVPGEYPAADADDYRAERTGDAVPG